MVAETDEFLTKRLSAAEPRLGDITQSTEAIVPAELMPIYGAKSADNSQANQTLLDPNTAVWHLQSAGRFGFALRPNQFASNKAGRVFG